MADSFLAQQLPRFTSGKHPSALCHQPFSFDIGGQTWAIASAGAWIVGVRGSNSYPSALDPTGTIERYLTITPARESIVDLVEVKAWAGDPPMGSPLDEDTDPVILQGVVIDVRKLAWILAKVPFPKITIWDASDDLGIQAVALESKGKWRAVLAGLDDDPDPKYRVFGRQDNDLMAMMSELMNEEGLPGVVLLVLLHLQARDDERTSGVHRVDTPSPPLAVPVRERCHGSFPSLGDVVGGCLNHRLTVLPPNGGVRHDPDGVVHVPLVVEGVPTREVVQRTVGELVGELLQRLSGVPLNAVGKPNLAGFGLERGRCPSSMCGSIQRKNLREGFSTVGPQGMSDEIVDNGRPCLDEGIPLGIRKHRARERTGGGPGLHRSGPQVSPDSRRQRGHHEADRKRTSS